MALVYRHIRLDSNQPFYIGIGQSEKRAYELINRNKHWYNIVNKAGYKVQIMMDDLTWEEACEKEREFIKLYGRADLGLGTLVNLTDGGDGGNGYKHTKEAKAKLSVALKGKPKSEEHKAKMSAAQKGKKRGKQTEETKAKTVATRKANGSYNWSEEVIEKRIAIRRANGNHRCSEETKAKLSATLTGRPRSEEAIAKTVATKKANGTNKPSEETKAKMSVARKTYYAKKRIENGNK